MIQMYAAAAAGSMQIEPGRSTGSVTGTPWIDGARWRAGSRFAKQREECTRREKDGERRTGMQCSLLAAGGAL